MAKNDFSKAKAQISSNKRFGIGLAIVAILFFASVLIKRWVNA